MKPYLTPQEKKSPSHILSAATPHTTTTEQQGQVGGASQDLTQASVSHQCEYESEN